MFYNEIVIGCTLESLLYCYFNNTPFVSIEPTVPNIYDYFGPNINIKQFGSDLINNKKLSKSILWHRLFFILNLKGLNLMPYECSSIRIDVDVLKAHTKTGRLGKFKFNTLYIFNDQNIENIPDPISTKDPILKVYDWMHVNGSSKHNKSFINTNNNLVKYIYFLSKRKILTISYINNKDLNKYDNSEVNARFKCIYEMKNKGIRKVNLIHSKREIDPVFLKYNYKDTDNIKFINKTYKEILKEYTNIDNNNELDRFLNELFKRKRRRK